MNILLSEMIQRIVDTKGPLLAISRFPHPADSFLYLVCIEHQLGQFVTWIYNSQDHGFSHGDYHTSSDPQQNRINAICSFNRRLSEKIRSAFGLTV